MDTSLVQRALSYLRDIDANNLDAETISMGSLEEYPILVGAIAFSLTDKNDRFDPNKLDIANQIDVPRRDLDRQIHQALVETELVRRENGCNPGEQNLEIFQNTLSTLLQSYASGNTYQVYFPLNIDGKGLRFQARGYLIEERSKAGIDSLLNTAVESLDPDGPVSLEEAIDDTFNSYSARQSYSWFEIKVDSSSTESAFYHTRLNISTILGKLNYCNIYMSDSSDEFALAQLLQEERLDREGINFIRFPPCYIICDSDGPKNAMITAQPIQEQPLVVDQQFKATYSDLDLKKFPLSEAPRIHGCFEDAFRGLQAGLTANTLEEAFLGYWRAMEDASLKDDWGNSAEVLDRISPFLTSDFMGLERYFNGIAQKRNTLAHSAADPGIVARDLLILQECIVSSLEELRSFAGYEDVDLIRKAIARVVCDENYQAQIDKKVNEIEKLEEDVSNRESELDAIKYARNNTPE